MNRILHIDNKFFWIGLAFIVKATMVATLLLLSSEDGNYKFYKEGGDTRGYISPIENLFSEGELRTHLASAPYHLRMPGFLPIYYPIRLLFSPETSLGIIVLIQVILSAISCYLLALLSDLLFGKKYPAIFLGTYAIYLISTYASVFDAYILTESLTSSLLIIVVYVLARYRLTIYSSLAIGCLMTWAIFLKPYLLVLLVFFALFKSFSKERKFDIQSLLLILAPYIFITFLWSEWNYMKHGDVVLLQKQRGHWPHLNKKFSAQAQLQELVRLFGGQYIAWDPNGHVYPFFQDPAKTPLAKDLFPQAVYTSNFNMDSLTKARDFFYQGYVNQDSVSLLEATNMLRRARLDYENQRKFDHYVTARWRCFTGFVFQNAAYNIPFPPFEQQNIFQMAIKAFYTILFWFVLTLGSIELVYRVFIKQEKQAILLAAIPGYLIVLFPLLLLKQEQRYAVAIYVFLVPFSVAFLLRILSCLLPQPLFNKIVVKANKKDHKG